MEMFTEKQTTAFNALKSVFGYTNLLESPRIKKVVVSTGTGKIADKKKIEVIQDRLAKITGQKAAPRGAKKSIAAFKLRQGDIIGYQVTLRGKRMHDFLDRMVHIALPRTRDFRGISPGAIDEMGNITIGVREHTIFPETADEEQKDIFSLSVTLVTTAKNRAEAEALLRHIGFPLKNPE